MWNGILQWISIISCFTNGCLNPLYSQLFNITYSLPNLGLSDSENNAIICVVKSVATSIYDYERHCHNS